MTPAALSPAEARAEIDGGARLVDIRGADEHVRERIPGAVNLPLDRVGELPRDSRPVIFHCRSGMRTSANATKLVAAAQGAPAYILSGGIDAWRSAEQSTITDRSQPMEIMRQVHLAAGGLVLVGMLLGLVVSPGFFDLSAFVGAGLVFSGATGWCGMAAVLRAMPWNRRAGA
ncbi:hypothetical protein DMC47_25510 [Nostoc sp. 3335mG]|nr:hypothetical protein DMC47_25510 [Nostoc sp. 3335mG]